MGLDTSHDCWHGPYSAFMRWRTAVCAVAGYGDYQALIDRGGKIPNPDDPIWSLLNHSDCEGEIPAEECAPLADALEKLLPGLRNAGAAQRAQGGFDYYEIAAQKFITGLRRAAAAGEAVEFR